MKQRIKYFQPYDSSIDKNQLHKLCLYYQQNQQIPVIIGMNDSMGVNTGKNPMSRSFFELIEEAFQKEGIDSEIIHCYSLLFNKTEHIDYFLNQNVSVQEIKRMQLYSYEACLYKLLHYEAHVPHFIANPLKYIGRIMKPLYHVNEKEKEIHLTEILEQNIDPIFIYSSGPNDLMRIYGNNPANMKHSYHMRNKNPEFNYTVKNVQNPEILQAILKHVEDNFEHIRTINPRAKIFALGIFVPKAFADEEMNVFRDIILKYNAKLKALCQKHNIFFIDTAELGEKYNNSALNFHLNKKGHKVLSTIILKQLYQQITNEKEEKEIESKPIENYHSDGDALGVAKEIEEDFINCVLEARQLDRALAYRTDLSQEELNYQSHHVKRLYDIAHEHMLEMDAATKAYQKSR